MPPPPPPHHRPSPDELFNRLDLNGDGNITKEEYETATKQMEQDKPPDQGQGGQGNRKRPPPKSDNSKHPKEDF
jgi:hypothetical protein